MYQENIVVDFVVFKFMLYQIIKRKIMRKYMDLILFNNRY